MIREDRQLTPHFSLYELTHTDIPDLQEKNRDLTDDEVLKLTNLGRFMELVRLMLDKPIIVTSGYRCLDVNNAVGGSPKSQHLVCEACDFKADGMTVLAAYQALIYESPFMRFGQIIYERRRDSEWVHISMRGTRPPEKCGQIFRNIVL